MSKLALVGNFGKFCYKDHPFLSGCIFYHENFNGTKTT